MSITVACRACGTKLRAPDSAAGRRARCSTCGGAVPVPETAIALAAPTCPHCDGAVSLTAKKCRHCGEFLRPQPTPLVSAASAAMDDDREYYRLITPVRQGTGKRVLPAFLLCFIFGAFGAHRFYVGKVGTGIVMLLLTLTFFGLILTVPWLYIDLIVIICGLFTDADGERLTEWT